MKLILRDGRRLTLSFDAGDKVIEGLKDFCKDEEIRAGQFWVIGAVNEVAMAWYDLDKKEYKTKRVEESLEIASMMGNVAIHDGEIIIHAHGLFSDDEMSVTGGHVNEMVVAAACEVFLIKLEGQIDRKFSDTLGLNLMDAS